MKKRIIGILLIVLGLLVALSAIVLLKDNTPKIEYKHNYYVMKGGEGDGRSQKSPASSVEEVISYINEDIRNDELTEDIAAINIIESKNWSKKVKDGKHNISYIGSIPNCQVDLVIQGDNGKKSHLAFKESTKESNLSVEDKYDNSIIFRNLVLVSTGEKSHIFLGGADVSFEKSVDFADANGWKGGRLKAGKELKIVHAAEESEEVTYLEDKTVNITAPAKSGNIYLPSFSRSNDTVYNSDLNLIIDNAKIGKDSAFGINLAAGGYQQSIVTTVNGNLNVNVKNASKIDFLHGGNPESYFKASAIQMILNGSVEYNTTDITSLSVVPDSTPVYLIINKSKDSELISFTEKEGVFAVKKGVTVVAYSKEKGEKIVSKDGKLTLKAGYYVVAEDGKIKENEVSFPEEKEKFTNDGETITVKNSCKIDLTQVKHTEKEDKVFIGWKNSKTNKAVKTVAEYKKGDKLIAEYIDFKENDFFIEETKVSEEVENGLLFIFSENKEFTKKLPKILEHGSIYLPTDTAMGAELYLESPTVRGWDWNKETKSDYIPTIKGESPITVLAKKKLDETDKRLKYALCIEELSETDSNEFFCARGYIKYNDLNGIERVVYTDYKQSSLYKASCETDEKEKTDIHKRIIEYVEKDAVDLYWQIFPITSYQSGTKDCTDTNPERLRYTRAGLTVADVTIKSGFKGIEKTEICFLTDPHLNYMNERDVKEGNETTLANYRARTWLGNAGAAPTVNNVMKYALNFKKIVVGGDTADSFTYGCLEIAKRLIGDKSVNGNIKMVLGNHEVMETGGNELDIEWSNKYTPEQRMEIIKDYWSNGIYYDSEIMKSSEGKDNIMLIYLDNSFGHYWDNQIEPLNKDLETARKKQIPVLIFQHIPMPVTPEEENSDEATAKLRDIIRKNSDVIKGMFNGHTHKWGYTDIVGLGEDGKPNGTFIPQRTAAGAHSGNVMKITVE